MENKKIAIIGCGNLGLSILNVAELPMYYDLSEE